MFIVTRYDFDTHKVHILYTVENFKDSIHLCFDKIIEDIDCYRKIDDQIIINNTHDIMVYRRGMIQGKYELFHYVVHEHPDEEEEEDED